MTVVAGLADPLSNTAILLADSRVTLVQGSVHYDICQKVAQLGNEGVFGFAGPIKSAAAISRWITGTFKNRGVGWLTSKSEVISLLKCAGAFGQSNPNGFLAAFMDDTRQTERGSPAATIVRFSTDGEYVRTTFGIEMTGTGSETTASIRPRLTDIVNFAGPGRGGIVVAQRALMMSEWIMDEAKSHSIDSVGGLMQVHFVEAGGVRAIPYERWIDLDERYGTHVSMDIDPAGAWVQSHQPTGLRVPLRFPDDHDFGAKSVNFELERLLTKNSPGVQLTPNPVAVFRPLQFDSRGWFVRTP